MKLSLVLLMNAAFFCCGSVSIPSKQVLNELFRRVDFKRQASDVDQCVDDRLQAASADEVCMIGEDEINTEGDDQQTINEIYKIFCKDLILRVTDECGGLRDSPGLREYISGLCYQSVGRRSM